MGAACSAHSARRRLLTLQQTVTDGTDAACARAVIAFQGDINAPVPKYLGIKVTLLSLAVEHQKTQTLAAFAARGDVVMYALGSCRETAMRHALTVGMVQALLEAFPGFDCNRVCRGSNGERPDCTPLELLAAEWNRVQSPVESLLALLDAGASPSAELWGRLRWHAAAHWHFLPVPWWGSPKATLVAILDSHARWLFSDRRAWIKCCARSATSLWCPVFVPADVLRCVLGDARLSMPPGPFGAPSHQLVSEYANMVAAFL